MKNIVSSTCLVLASCLAVPAFAANASPQAGDILVRARAIGIMPIEKSSTSIGGTADFSTQVVPELDATYFITDQIGVEVIAATARHHAKARDTGAGTFDAGSAWVLPPTVTLQYHFTDLDWVKPYIGAGLNYTMYLDEEPGSQSSLKIKDSFGYALQAGMDVPIDERWSWNFDVKKLFVKANAEWNGGAVSANIDLDPWIVGTGIGYRF